MLGILLILNMLASFDRADYVTSIAAILAIFFLNDNSDINRDKFRYLPIVMLISVVYDIIWLFLIQDRAHEGEVSEGGLESTVINVAIWASYANLFFKVSYS